MIKILDNSKSLDLLINDTTNGLGQFEATSCLITEELNGIYECEIEMLATDEHFNDIQVGGLLEIPVSEIKKQIFRIYFISKPINQVVQIKAQHITYDLNKVPVKPFSATGAVNAKNGMLNNTMGTYPFTMTTNITNTTSKFILDIPRSFRECLGGYEGSLLDTFRCEYEWDNLEVKMLSKRGNDNGVRIAYGKNLTDFNQEENIENVYTSVLGYAVVNDITYTGEIYHKVQATYPKVLIVDFSDQYEQDTTPTTADLTTKAQEYATNNDIEVPNVNLSISFVPLWQTEEYKNVAPLERVSLGDTVHVFFDKLGVEASARVVKTVFNANLNRFDCVELGNAKANLNTVINEVVSESKKEVANSENFLAAQLNDMATLIINGLGLHRTYVDVAGGGQRMYLHNKPTLAESDTQYVMAANGFLVSTDYGQTWNAGFDAQGNAVVNSLSTITLKALEIYGSYLCFGDYPNGKYIEASTYSNASSVPQGVSFDGTGYIRLRPKEEFNVTNLSSSNQTINSFRMTGSSENISNINLQNYNKQYGILANQLYMSSRNSGVNLMELDNYRNNNGTRLSGNTQIFYTSETTNYTQFSNNNSYGEDANSITIGANTTSNYVSFANNDFNRTNNTSNSVYLYSSGTDEYASIVNGNLTSGSTTRVANTLELSKTSEQSKVLLKNRYDATNTSLYNSISMVGNLNTQNANVTVSNYNNSIEMSSGTTNKIVLTNYSPSSGRTNTLEMDEGGNFNLESSDDINIDANDRNIVRGGNLLVLQSKDIQLWLGGQQVHLYLDGGVVKYRT